MTDTKRPSHLPRIEDIPRRDRAPMFPNECECYINNATNHVSQWNKGMWHSVAAADDSFWHGGYTPDWRPH